MRQTCDFEGADKRIACILRTGRSRGRWIFIGATTFSSYNDYYEVYGILLRGQRLLPQTFSTTLVLQ